MSYVLTEMNDLKNYPLMAGHDRDHKGPELFVMSELSGVSPIPNKYPPRTGRLIP